MSPSQINEDGELEYDDEVHANIRWIRSRMCAFRCACVRACACACMCVREHEHSCLSASE
jgi:hypothetical protein